MPFFISDFDIKTDYIVRYLYKMTANIWKRIRFKVSSSN